MLRYSNKTSVDVETLSKIDGVESQYFPNIVELMKI